MGLHLEIDGGASLREWTAAGVIALIMVGQGDAAAELARTINLKPAGATEAGAATAPVPMMPPLPTAVPVTPAAAAEALMALAERTRVVPSGTEQVGGEPLPEGSAELPAVPVDMTDLDKAGLPWDIRIHAGGKTKNKDGTWRGKRGVDPALVAAVEAELKAIMGAPAVTAADVAAGAVPPPPPPVPEVSAMEGHDAEGMPIMTDPAAAFGGPGNAPAVPAPPVTPAVGTDTPAATNGPAVAPPASPSSEAPAGDMGEFARIMRVVTAKQKAGMGTEVTTTIAQQLGLTSVRDLVKRPDLIPAFEALLP